MEVLLGILFSAFAFLMVTGYNVFRSDYEYDDAANGWFKFHGTPAMWEHAELRCFLEGAVLASPLDNGLSGLIANVINEHKSGLSFGMHLGIHNRISIYEYSTVEGVPLSTLALQTNQMFSNEYSESTNCVRQFPGGALDVGNCSDALPFMCFKKKTKSLEITECGTVDKKYQLDTTSGHCYKFHKRGLTWPLAYMTCVAEGGHLAIINSAAEADVLKKLFAKYPAADIRGVYKDGAHIGFLDLYKEGIWRTIHGEALEEAGYEQWGRGEPNNQFYKGRHQYCGSMFRSGLLDDTYCDLPLAFICEKDPSSLRPAKCNDPRQ